MIRARSTIAGGATALLVVIAGCGQSADDRPASWSYISTVIVQPNCATANCHATITQRLGIDLSTIQVGYESLIKQKYVVKGQDRATSPLLDVLRGQGGIQRRMPPDFGLPNADINLIERWILADSPYDGPGTPSVP